MPKKIIIIGAGIAGLSAGCYARMNGFDVQIFELHHIPGGLCTAWKRKNYLFDGCIHYLYGTGEGKPFHNIWKELGALDQTEIVNHSELMTVVNPNGDCFTAYCDPDQLEEEACRISPQDRPFIRDFCNAVRQFQSFDLSLLQQKPRALWKASDWSNFGRAMLPFLPAMARWAGMSAGEFGRRFKSEFLQRAFPLVFGWPEIPMMAGISILAYMSIQNAGFPRGASEAFARAIEKRFLDLGGVIHYNAQVEKILVRDHRAVGIRLYSDDLYEADYVVSAADGRTTLFDMLDGRYLSPDLRRVYDQETGLAVHPMIQVSLGVRRDFSDQPHWVTYLLEEPLLLAGEERRDFGLKHYCFDPATAPSGCSALEVILRIKYAYWQHIYGHRLYDSEQDQVADVLIAQIAKIYPDIREDIELIDVATPMSYERYTGNWRGSSVGWLLDKRAMFKMMQGMRKDLPGLRNFYMAGQWVEPGGSVPVVAMSGRNAVQLICHQEGMPFEVCLPASG